VRACRSTEASPLETSGPGDSALLSVKLIKNAQLKIYKGAPHGMCSTLKDQISEDLLAFCKS
jgi:non-heme chloroperoxidase